MAAFLQELKVTEEELKNLHLAGVHESDIINLLKDAFGI